MNPPLTREHLEKMNHALHEIAILLPEIDKAIKAGIDVSQQRNAALLYQSRLMQLKSTYFPGQP